MSKNVVFLNGDAEVTKIASKAKPTDLINQAVEDLKVAKRMAREAKKLQAKSIAVFEKYPRLVWKSLFGCVVKRVTKKMIIDQDKLKEFLGPEKFEVMKKQILCTEYVYTGALE
jgi:hypothetical protein